ncbi:hypothetical protein IEE94_01755 [Yimella sp. cx-573]|nr:hypothetical protein [Yimella sp. cx-573]
MSDPIAYSPNRFRALRYASDSVLIGIGSREPQLVGPLGDDAIRTVLRAGPLTGAQWATAFRKLDPSSADALRAAVRQVEPGELRAVDVTVDGHGPVADAARQVITALGARVVPDRCDVIVSIGAPGTLVAAVGRTQLVVELGSDQVVVGPLLRETSGPCANCLDVRRRQFDANWPHLATQMQHLSLCDGAPSTAPELTHVAVGLIGLVVRGHANGRPLPPGIALRATTDDYSISHHLWPVHPLCGCRTAAGATVEAMVG